MHNPPFVSTRRPRLTLLIDAENLSARKALRLMSHVADRGDPIIRRAYADWTNPRHLAWRRMLHALAIRPMQQFLYAHHKNASNAALIMDAMELRAQRPRLDGICIASCDSDFTGIAGRIREADIAVYGFGRPDASPAFVAACDAFVYL
jgi:uncharacterized LabA/DUF88 family protein